MKGLNIEILTKAEETGKHKFGHLKFVILVPTVSSLITIPLLVQGA